MPRRKKGHGWTKTSTRRTDATQSDNDKKSEAVMDVEVSKDQSMEVSESSGMNCSLVSDNIIPVIDASANHEWQNGRIVRASFAQNSIHFSSVSRGAQCMGMTVISIAYNEFVSPFLRWNGSNLDEILYYGDQFYLAAINQRKIMQSTDSSAKKSKTMSIDVPADNSTDCCLVNDQIYLMSAECELSFSLVNHGISIKTTIRDCVEIFGLLEEEHVDPQILILSKGLETFFQTCKNGFLTCASKTIAIFKNPNDNEQGFATFDSHSRNEHGFTTLDSDGKACLLFHEDLPSLVEFILHLFRIADAIFAQPYTLSEIKCTIVRYSDIYHRNLRFHLPRRADPRFTTQPLTSLITTPTFAIPATPSRGTVNKSNRSKLASLRTGISEFKINKRREPCSHCDAISYETETSHSVCCLNGKIKLAPLKSADLPSPFRDLYSRDHPKSRDFFKSIRAYNNMLAMASISASTTMQPGGAWSHPVLIISGNVYHNIADVNPTDVRYGSLYFHDPQVVYDDARRKDVVHQFNLDADLLNQLHQCIASLNPHARLYKNMRDVLREYDGDVANVHIRFNSNVTIDRGTHNAPANPDEIGAIFVSDDGDVPTDGKLRVYYRGDDTSARVNFTQISHTSHLSDPLCYPVLFPRGELGWQPNIKLPGPIVSRRTRVTMRDYYSYHMAMRSSLIGCNNYLLIAGRLFQQFVIDAYVKIESDRLNYIRYNQEQLRADTYVGLIDHLKRLADKKNAANRTTIRGEGGDNIQLNDNDNRCGRMIVLPSTFTGGQRSMESYYQDAMTIACRYGRPTFFITMTCNPKWSEITQELLPDQTPQDRPDVVSRIFHCKMKDLIKTLVKDKFFGTVVAWVYSVEFQKRGLPHMHLLLFVEEAARPREPHEIDEIVCAELPNETHLPDLYALVSKFMVHGPCGRQNANAPCTNPKTGLCDKGYPKSYSDNTEIDFSGRVRNYRRRNDHNRVVRSFRGADAILDNRHVVSYNPYLLSKYNCHINVDIVGGLQTVKYLFKYVLKGHDQAYVNFNVATETVKAEIDEVQDYIDTRFIGSCEAVWRIFVMEITAKSHHVERLEVHLPGHSQVYFRAGDDLIRKVKDKEKKLSKLEAFFALNKKLATVAPDSIDHKYPLLYLEVPYFYRFIENTGLWQRRIYRTRVLSRMYTISPRWIEQYHLRLLLLHVPGPTCFEDLLTVNDVRYDRFQKAAIAAGLTRSDIAWDKTMQDAIFVQRPSNVRKVFCYLLVFCEVSDPQALWRKFHQNMSEDFARRIKDPARVYKRLIRWIDRFLKYIGVSEGIAKFHLLCDDPSLPLIDDHEENYEDDDDSDDIINDIANNIELSEFDESNLNAQQRKVFDRLMKAIDDNDITVSSTAVYIYLQGCAGTGKTYLYNVIIAALIRRKIQYKAVAFTGIAASLMIAGQTVHSAFRLPLNVKCNSTSSITLGTDEAIQLSRVKLIIWDEISTTSKYLIDAVDRLLRDIHDKRTVPFGGVNVLFGGDIRQLLPVATTRVQSQELCFINCKSWSYFHRIDLTINMRANEDRDFAEWLMKLGDGVLQKELFAERIKSKRNRLPPNTVEIPSTVLTSDLITDVFGDDVVKKGDLKSWANVLHDRAILCPRNDQCDAINDEILHLLPGTESKLLSIDLADTDQDDLNAQYPTEHLNRIRMAGLPDHTITLKVGAPVMLLRNLCIADGLINGTRMIVTEIRQNLLTCEILCGRFKGDIVYIPRIDASSKPGDFPFILKRRQFPVRLCFALTINKAQGQTLQRVGLNLPSPVFAHGQLYVGFSRVRNWAGIKVSVGDVANEQGALDKNKSNVYTQNIVFHSILNSVLMNSNR